MWIEYNNITEEYHSWIQYKVLSSTILKRITPYINYIIGDNQCSSTSVKSTIDHILSFNS